MSKILIDYEDESFLTSCEDESFLTGCEDEIFLTGFEDAVTIRLGSSNLEHIFDKSSRVVGEAGPVSSIIAQGTYDPLSMVISNGKL